MIKDYGFRGNFLYYVRLTRRLYEQAMSKAAAQCGLTMPEADVLSFLQENSEYDSARDIALYRDVSRPYVSKAVDLLVKRGFAKIAVDIEDRRIQHISLTENACEASVALQEALLSFYKEVTSGVSDEELAIMMAAIKKCAANLAEKAD